MFSYIWFQTFFWCPRSRNPVRIRIRGSMAYITEDIWHQKHECNEGFYKYLKYSFNRIIKLSLHSRYRDLDPNLAKPQKPADNCWLDRRCSQIPGLQFKSYISEPQTWKIRPATLRQRLFQVSWNIWKSWYLSLIDCDSEYVRTCWLKSAIWSV